MNLPHVAKRAFGSQMRLFGKKKAAVWRSPSSSDKKNADFFKHFIIIFRLILGAARAFRGLRGWAIFCGWYTILQFQPHQGGQMQLGFDGNPILLSGWCCMAHAAIFTGTGPYSHMQSGASPGSSVGNANDWILFLWSIGVIPCLCFRSATSHLVQNTQKRHFLTQNTTFDP